MFWKVTQVTVFINKFDGTESLDHYSHLSLVSVTFFSHKLKLNEHKFTFPILAKLTCLCTLNGCRQTQIKWRSLLKI